MPCRSTVVTLLNEKGTALGKNENNLLKYIKIYIYMYIYIYIYIYIKRYIYLKIILLNHQNNCNVIFKLIARMSESFAALLIILEIPNYFDNPTKLSSDLYLS